VVGNHSLAQETLSQKKTIPKKGLAECLKCKSACLASMKPRVQTLVLQKKMSSISPVLPGTLRDSVKKTGRKMGARMSSFSPAFS
jgi:hypothetical protein